MHTCVVCKTGQLDKPIPGKVAAFQSSSQDVAQCLIKPLYLSIAGWVVWCSSSLLDTHGFAKRLTQIVVPGLNEAAPGIHSGRSILLRGFLLLS